MAEDSNARGQATAGAKNDEGSDRLPRATTPPGPDELAVEFLGEIADLPGPWPEYVLRWSADHGLTVVDLKALQRAIGRAVVSRRRRP